MLGISIGHMPVLTTEDTSRFTNQDRANLQDTLHRKINRIFAEENLQSKEIAVLAGVIILSLASSLAFLNVSRNLPFHEGLKWTCVVTNIYSWSLLKVYSISGKALEKVQGQTEAEKALAEQLSKHAQVIAAFAIVLLGLAAQIPNELPVLQYNDKEVAPLVLVASWPAESFYSIMSFFLTAKFIYRLIYSNKKDLTLQREIKNIFFWNKAIFEQLPHTEKMDLANELLAIKSMPKDPERLKAYYRLLTKNLPAEIQNSKEAINCKKALPKIVDCVSPVPSGKRPLLTVAGLTTSAFFLANYTWFTSLYTPDKLKEFVVNNEATAQSLSPLIVGANLYLMGRDISACTVGAFQKIASLFARERKPSLVEQFYGRKIDLIQAAHLASNLFAVGAFYEIILNYFQNNPGMQRYFAATVCPAIFLMLEMASLSTVSRLAECYALKNGNADQKKQMHISLEFDSIAKLIEDMEPKYAEVFSELLSNEARQKIGLEAILAREEGITPAIKEEVSEVELTEVP